MAESKTRGIGFDEENADLQRGKNYVLAIAIDDYEDRPLANCVNDMTALTAALPLYHGFEPGDIKIMKNGEAGRAAVIREIRNFSNMMTERDNFILYFSGHGIIDKIDQEGYWLLSGCDFNNYSIEGINNQDILRYVRSMKARHILLLVDSCFSGSLFYSARGNDVPVHNADVRERFSSRWAITAGRQEGVSDGEAGGHSPFAKKLIEYLHRNDHPNGHFSVSELAGFLKQSVHRNANQYPDGRPLQNAGDDGGEFIFYLKSGGIPPVLPKADITKTETLRNAGFESQEITNDIKQEISDHSIVFSEIRDLVSKSNLEKALEKLAAVNPDAVLLQQTYSTAKRENMMGLLTHDEWFRKRNQVSYNILEMLK